MPTAAVDIDLHQLAAVSNDRVHAVVELFEAAEFEATGRHLTDWIAVGIHVGIGVPNFGVVSPHGRMGAAAPNHIVVNADESGEGINASRDQFVELMGDIVGVAVRQVE